MTAHPIELACIVIALGIGFAALMPFRGLSGFARNVMRTLVFLCALIAIGVVTGAVIRDFVIESVRPK